MLIGLAVLGLVLTGTVYFLTYHPDPVEAAEMTCPTGTPSCGRARTCA